MEFKDIIRQFEKGAVFQVQDETGIFLAGNAQKPATWELALAYLTNFEKYYNIKLLPDAQILLDTTETIPDILSDVPDIVYEIMPYAEKPLELKMNHVKPIFEHLTNEDKKVGLRYIRNSKFTEYLVASSTYWFGCYLQNVSLPMVQNVQFPLNKDVFDLDGPDTLPSLNFKSGKQKEFKKLKKLALELDGSFQFITE